MREILGNIAIGTVTEALPNTTFRVRLDDNTEVLGYLSGKMRLYKIKVMIGDKVKVERNSAQDTKARIVQRM
jgi:translation initiation factor IF-1